MATKGYMVMLQHLWTYTVNPSDSLASIFGTFDVNQINQANQFTTDGLGMHFALNIHTDV